MKLFSEKKPAAPARSSSILGLLKPYSGMVGLLVLFALVGNGLNLLIPVYISRAIDAFGAGNQAFGKSITWFLITAFCIMLANYLQGVAQTYTSEKAARDLRNDLAERLSLQSYAYMLRSNPARLLTNLTSDIDSIKLFISQAVSSIVSSVFVIIGASILLLMINWKLALAVLTIIPIIGGAFYLMLRKVRVLFRKSREVIDWLNRVINESILSSMLIRILNSQQQEYQKFLKANITSRDLGLEILGLFAALIPIITFVSNMAVLTILALGGHFVITGEMTLGNYAAFNSYIAILIFPILVIGFMSTIIAHASASFQRVQEVLDTPRVIHKGTHTSPLSGQITLRNVSVLYHDKPALKNINLDMESGSKVAIIGPTAAGKTQLLYLLTGLIKANTGEVLFDGKNIDDYRQQDFYRQVGFVFQDSIIFNMTIRENIAFSENITDEMLEKAIAAAELKGFIETLPNHLDTIISERGSSLSGGQKQRIMLARALALNPRILLLDDFTARVDRNTERKIMDNIQTYYPGISIITITQKIAPVSLYEQIVLLMEGEIVASGKHEHLLRTCPEYIQIYNSQRSTSHYDLPA